MKSEFTAVVSHELRTPLTSIRGSLGLILGALSASLPPKVKDLLEIAQNNCERLVLLVNDILDIEKFTAGQMRFDIADRAARRHWCGRPSERTKATRASSTCASSSTGRRSGARVDGRPGPLHPGHVEPACRTRRSIRPPAAPCACAPRPRGERVRVSVRDDGPGIPEEFRARIFEKFSQADASATREKGGTGLGLHIAQAFRRTHARHDRLRIRDTDGDRRSGSSCR